MAKMFRGVSRPIQWLRSRLLRRKKRTQAPEPTALSPKRPTHVFSEDATLQRSLSRGSDRSSPKIQQTELDIPLEQSRRGSNASESIWGMESSLFSDEVSEASMPVDSPTPEQSIVYRGSTARQLIDVMVKYREEKRLMQQLHEVEQSKGTAKTRLMDEMSRLNELVGSLRHNSSGEASNTQHSTIQAIQKSRKTLAEEEDSYRVWEAEASSLEDQLKAVRSRQAQLQREFFENACSMGEIAAASEEVPAPEEMPATEEQSALEGESASKSSSALEETSAPEEASAPEEESTSGEESASEELSTSEEESTSEEGSASEKLSTSDDESMSEEESTSEEESASEEGHVLPEQAVTEPELAHESASSPFSAAALENPLPALPSALSQVRAVHKAIRKTYKDMAFHDYDAFLEHYEDLRAEGRVQTTRSEFDRRFLKRRIALNGLLDVLEKTFRSAKRRARDLGYTLTGYTTASEIEQRYLHGSYSSSCAASVEGYGYADSIEAAICASVDRNSIHHWMTMTTPPDDSSSISDDSAREPDSWEARSVDLCDSVSMRAGGRHGDKIERWRAACERVREQYEAGIDSVESDA